MQESSSITAFEGATLGIALAGLVLGVLNLAIVFWERRFRLRVVPSLAYQQSMSGELRFLSISVTNLSEFPVFIEEVGIALPKGKKAVSSSWKGDPLPTKLEPRMSASFRLHEGAFVPALALHAKAVYARTGCGRTVTGTNKLLMQLVRISEEALNK